MFRERSIRKLTVQPLAEHLASKRPTRFTCPSSNDMVQSNDIPASPVDGIN